MRKIFRFCLLLTLLLFVSSCENELDLGDIETTEMESDFISMQEAIDLAEQMAAELYIPASRAEIRHSSPFLCSTISVGNSRGENGEILHVVNFADSMGYALVTTARCNHPVLMMVDCGTYNEDEANNVPGFNLMFSAVKNTAAIIGDTIKRGEITLPDHKKNIEIIDTLAYYNYPLSLELDWGQRHPEGEECSNGLSGCVPTAILMSMAHLKSPSTITYTYLTNPITENLNWEVIRLHKGTEDFSNTCSGLTHETIARICRQIGEIGNADYSKSTETSIATYRIPGLTRYFLPNHIVSDFVDYFGRSICNNLTLGGITILDGRKYDHYQNEVPDIGHAWIADGGKYVEIRYRRYLVDSFVTHDYEYFGTLVEEVYDSYGMIHHNFGKYGEHNCYISSLVCTDNFLIYEDEAHPDKTIRYGKIKMINIRPR